MHNVAIIGSGRRVQQNFLPALSCLRSHFNLLGIFSRTYNNARFVAKKWGCEAFETFECIPLHDISVVAISITSQSVPEILRKLEAYPKKLTVVLDTPALASFRDLNVLRRVSQSHRVLVAEDFMNFPQFHLMRKALESGLIGKVQSINMRQSGYLIMGLHTYGHSSASDRYAP
jgi:Predicted dehydrogenases and related proteins